jgi:uncharacterized membrane protein
MTTPSTARRAGAVTPKAVGPRLTLVVAVVAAAIMFAAGFFAGAILAKMVGAPDSATTIAGYIGGGALALFSAQGSARRMLRRRASRAG